MRLLVFLSIIFVTASFYPMHERGFAASDCSGISALTDPDAIRMENGETVLWNHVHPNLLIAKDKYEALIEAKGWKITYHSAYRPMQYQQHFYEIIHSASGICKDNEIAKHGLTGSVSKPNANSPHVKGTAFDAKVYNQNGQALNGKNFVRPELVALAKQAGLQFPLPSKDGVHHEITSTAVKSPVTGASSSVKSEQLVRTAESYAGSLKWAISVEGTGDGVTIPWNFYNGTKQAYQNAISAVSNLPNGKQKSDLQTRLENNVNLYISTTPGKVGRAVAYIDAINAGRKIEIKNELLTNRLDSNFIDDLTEQYYHELSREIKKQAYLLDRVYGVTTRDLIRKHFKVSAEQTRERGLYPVSIHMALKQYQAEMETGNFDGAVPLQTEIDKQIKEGLEKGLITAPIYDQLNSRYETLQKSF